ncbi:MAG: family 43 glycosylhydrolase [Dysgonamonadaceae bacterium]|jgi:hypothetical protein|nr:family 43 glycosylhydrolase [Dysgonamonadaceae bacterium]
MKTNHLIFLLILLNINSIWAANNYKLHDRNNADSDASALVALGVYSSIEAAQRAIYRYEVSYSPWKFGDYELATQRFTIYTSANATWNNTQWEGRVPITMYGESWFPNAAFSPVILFIAPETAIYKVNTTFDFRSANPGNTQGTTLFQFKAKDGSSVEDMNFGKNYTASNRIQMSDFYVNMREGDTIAFNQTCSVWGDPFCVWSNLQVSGNNAGNAFTEAEAYESGFYFDYYLIAPIFSYLTDKIAAAEALIAMAVPGTTAGTYPVEAIESFQSAIDTAKDFMAQRQTDATQAEINVQLAALTAAYKAFLSSVFAETWTNPLTLSGELVPHGIGDPYILKYKGVYYLYASNDTEQALRCWTSKNLINWSDAVICSTDPTIVVAYAPEVIYWNGTFYMYTSPWGNGHYVLTSTSPTGPFTVATGNLGKVIDGSVFIDDDGKMYFYHADGAGIFGCPMPTPTSIGTDVNLGAQMNGQWTEGPCVFKRNDLYYLLYTGNHVLSQGYRIDYATNTTNPIGKYTPQAAQNPVLIKSEGAFSGVGHGTAFIGPDLDTYYFTYHNLDKTGGGQPYRKYNFDRIAWNGDKMSILGPTNWAQQAPQLAVTDYFDRNEIGEKWIMPSGGNWGISNREQLFQDTWDEVSENGYKAIFTSETANDYTAEFTIRETARKNDEATLGAVFSYSDEQNYGVALFNSHENHLEINFLINNVWGIPQYFSLPTDFNYAVWHSIRIEKSETNFKFFVDGMKKASLPSNLGGGKAGYITRDCKGDFSYIAISRHVKGSGIFDTYKPLPGNISAVHYVTGGEGSIDTSANPEGGYHIVGNQAGEWRKYNVNVEADGVYNVGVRYAASALSQIKIWQGENCLTEMVALPATGGMDVWRTFTIKGLNLTAGYQTLKIETVTGNFNFYEMQFVHADNETVVKTDNFENGFSSDWNYTDGNWTIVSGQADINGFGKKTLGSVGWTDYTIEADVKYISGMNAGVIFRVNNPAAGGENNNPALGTDFLQGYFVGLSNTSVGLGKHNYGWQSLSSVPGTYSTNTTYHIKIVVSGANIKVYVTDMVNPKIDYTDTNPFISGKVGLRSCDTHARFDNFSVATNADNSVGIVNLQASEKDVEIFPNPVSQALTIRNISAFSNLAIYRENGEEIYRKELSGSSCVIDTTAFDKGLYILKLENKLREKSVWKFIKE